MAQSRYRLLSAPMTALIVSIKISRLESKMNILSIQASASSRLHKSLLTQEIRSNNSDEKFLPHCRHLLYWLAALETPKRNSFLVINASPLSKAIGFTFLTYFERLRVGFESRKYEKSAQVWSPRIHLHCELLQRPLSANCCGLRRKMTGWLVVYWPIFKWQLNWFVTLDEKTICHEIKHPQSQFAKRMENHLPSNPLCKLRSESNLSKS